MLINFLSLSPLISLIAISFFYAIRHQNRGINVIRIFMAILLAPACVSSGYLLLITAQSKVIINNFSSLEFMPLALGFQIDVYSALFVLFLLFFIVTLLLFLPDENFIFNISFSSIIFSTLIVAIYSPDLFIKTVCFSIGILIATLLIIHDDNSKNIVRQITTDFVLQRCCDLMIFSALLLMLTKDKTLLRLNLINNNLIDPIVRISCFFTFALRIISLLIIDIKSSNINIFIKNSFIRKSFIANGSLIIISQFAPLIFNDKTFNFIFSLFSCFILLLATILLFFTHNKLLIISRISTILTASSLLALCLGYSIVSYALIFILLAVYPLVILGIAKNYLTIDPPKVTEKPRIISFINHVFFIIPTKAINYTAKMFVNIFNPIYSGILLFRLPQVLMSILQNPLRLFHNGNIQRSLMFAAVIFFAYISFWSKR